MNPKLSALITAPLAALVLAACSPSPESAPATSAAPEPAEAPADSPQPEIAIGTTPWGVTPQGERVTLHTLRNRAGMVAEITNYGGIVVSLTAPDRAGRFEDVVLGYDNLDDYVAASPYFGALIGRYGNRIDEGRFSLDGVDYTLATNNGPNHLHGGDRGFDKVVWEARTEETEAGPALHLAYTSVDGEEGYPGTLVAKVSYSLTNDNELVIEYEAQTDRATPVNLTNHSYFNLSGDARRDILGHSIQINAEHYTPVDETLIPTGEYRPVAGTAFDFRAAKPIGRDIEADDDQIRYGLGYDHNWVIDREADGKWRHIATLSEPESGRVMTIHSNEPGLQFYSGNFLDGSNVGKGGVVYRHRDGMCLETQHFPDSPNQPGFPSTILRPGEEYRTRTVYTFGTDG